MLIGINGRLRLIGVWMGMVLGKLVEFGELWEKVGLGVMGALGVDALRWASNTMAIRWVFLRR